MISMATPGTRPRLAKYCSLAGSWVHEPAKLQYFASLGLCPAVAIEIMGRAPFNRPMRLRVGIGHRLSSDCGLWVT